MNMLCKALAAAVVAGGLGFGFVPAQAGPLPGPSVTMMPTAETASPAVEQVRYRHRGWRHRQRGPQIYFSFGDRRGGHYRSNHYRNRFYHNRHRSW